MAVLEVVDVDLARRAARATRAIVAIVGQRASRPRAPAARPACAPARRCSWPPSGISTCRPVEPLVLTNAGSPISSHSAWSARATATTSRERRALRIEVEDAPVGVLRGRRRGSTRRAAGSCRGWPRRAATRRRRTRSSRISRPPCSLHMRSVRSQRGRPARARPSGRTTCRRCRRGSASAPAGGRAGRAAATARSSR